MSFRLQKKISKKCADICVSALNIDREDIELEDTCLEFYVVYFKCSYWYDDYDFISCINHISDTFQEMATTWHDHDVYTTNLPKGFNSLSWANRINYMVKFLRDSKNV